MDLFPMMRAACAVAAWGAAGAFAQSPPAVITDVSPTPAEERNSVGAVVLDRAPVRAQRDTGVRPARTSPEIVGRDVMRETLRQMGAPPAPVRRTEPADMFNRSADGEIGPK